MKGGRKRFCPFFCLMSATLRYLFEKSCKPLNPADETSGKISNALRIGWFYWPKRSAAASGPWFRAVIYSNDR